MRALRIGLAALTIMTAGWGWTQLPSPRQAIGIEVGTDRVLASYAQIEGYLRALAASSPRTQLVELGASVEGRQIVGVAISTPANLANLAEWQRRWQRITDPRGLGDGELPALVASTPVCALVTAGIHSTEVAGPQAVLLLAHELATTPEGSPLARSLEGVIVVLVPSLNPDGHEMTVDWYRRTLGTPHEGSSPPFLYHRYAGHDNNRDFVFLNLPETRALNRFLSHDWRPQMHLDLHQMGSQGPRQFVPPFADPVAPLVHPLVWRMTSLLGGLMALRLEEDGRAGVASGWQFDGAWIGGTRNTGWWKNIFGVLTETAGTALATPIHVDENELRAGGKGLVDYRQQLDFPNPWRGGRWGLPEAVAYQRVLMLAFVEFASTWRSTVLGAAATLGSHAVRQGEAGSPWGWVIPPHAPDPGRARHLVWLLTEAGVEAQVARTSLRVDGRVFPEGSVVLAAAQPLRQYLLEVMEPQPYPEVRPVPGAEPLLPYDVTAWSLPLFLGVPATRVETKPQGEIEPLTGTPFAVSEETVPDGHALVVPASQLDAYLVANRALAAGIGVRRVGGAGSASAPAFVLSGETAVAGRIVRDAGVTASSTPHPESGGRPLRPVRVGVFHPDVGLEDAGWCRLVLERAGFAVEVVDRRRLGARDLATAIDVLILPSMDRRVLAEGRAGWRPVVPVPPEYQGGMGSAGASAVRSFVAGGGTAIAMGGSAEWLAEVCELLVSAPTRNLSRAELLCPGALLSVEMDAASPLSWGLPARLAVMIDDPLGFETRPAGPTTARHVGARFPDEPLLVAGWIRGEEKLRRRAAAVVFEQGPGRVVLFAFSPHFRAQTQAAFPLLLNAIGMEMEDTTSAHRSRASEREPRISHRGSARADGEADPGGQAED